MKISRNFVCCLRAIVCILVPFSWSNAYADADDVFNLIGSVASGYDSNLFKLPNGQTPSTPTGSTQRWDNINVTGLELSLDKKYALQRFQLDYQIISTKYQNNGYLDFDAKDYKYAWVWAISPELTGNIYLQQNQTLASFSDYRNGNLQNIITTSNKNFDFDYSPHDVWHFIGRYAEIGATNSQVFSEQTSFSSKNYEGGLKYVFNSQSYVALALRDTTGVLLGQNLDYVLLTDNGFKQSTADISGLWFLTGKSKLDFDFAYTAYKANTFSQRDYSGSYGSLIYTWDVLPKTSVAFNLSRKLEAYVTTTSSYILTDSIGITPTWNVSPKLLLKPNIVISKREFLGQGSSVSAIERQDKVLKYGLSIDWLPRNYIKTNLSIQHQNRNSNNSSYDFLDNFITVSAQLDF